MNWKQLQQAKADLQAESKEIIAAAETDKRRFTDDERQRLDDITAEMVGIDSDIERLNALRSREAAAGTIEINPDPATADEKKTSGFGNIGAMALAAAAYERTGIRDPRFAAISGASEGVGADGGFLVGEDIAAGLIRPVHETAILLSRVQRRTITAPSNRLRLRAFNETSRADGSRLGGIQVYRDGEGDTLTGSKPEFRWIDFELAKMTGLFYATDELMQDQSLLDAEIASWFAEEFGFKNDNEILNGTGVGQMQGILNAAALVTVSKETGQAAATVVFENIVKMWSRMYARSRQNAVWLINQDVEPQLFSMSLSVGTGGVPVYLPANGLSGSPFGMLMGRPVIPVEQCATLGTVGDIVLADLSQYTVAEKGGVQAATSMHVKFLQDEMAFRFILRNDGKTRWNSALTPFKGSNTQSPFVALATRS